MGTDAGRDVGRDAAPVDLEELYRLAAREMIAVALEAERHAYLEAHADVLDAAGRRLVVGNGYARADDHHRRRAGRGQGPAGG